MVRKRSWPAVSYTCVQRSTHIYRRPQDEGEGRQGISVVSTLLYYCRRETHPYAHLDFPPVDLHLMYLTYPKHNGNNVIVNFPHKNMNKRREGREKRGLRVGVYGCQLGQAQDAPESRRRSLRSLRPRVTTACRRNGARGCSSLRTSCR